MHIDDYQHGRKVTLIGIIGNVFVTSIEFALGILGQSSALVADALHSLSDVGATVAVLFGLKYSSLPKDENHPYGHGKIESVIALFLGIILAVTGIYLLYENIIRIQNKTNIIPEWYTLGAAVLTIVVKEWMFRYTMKAGKKLNSPSISANAHHHRSDAFTSVGVFFGILGAHLGYPILDPVAALIVAVFILRMSFEIVKDALMDLTDVTIPEELSTEIEKEVEHWNSEYRIVDLKGRRMGTRYHVNAKIRIGPYVQAIDGVTDLRALEKRLIQKIPVIQGVDIKGDVDSKRVGIQENRFKEHVRSILKKYSNRYRTIESLEFHFMPNQVEAHFNMKVDPGISVGEAHEITNLIEHEIIEKFDSAQVIIHIEPAEQ